MKKIICFLLMTAVVSSALKAQTPAEQLAAKIAQKMKDSLSLTESQKIQLYDINIQLNDLKSATRQQYSATDSLSIKIQKIENTRDSLYRQVLTEPQFLLYRQKKRGLVNNN